MKISKWYCDFDRRITAMTWHPTVADTVAIGSKSGDIILWNFEQDGQKPRAFIKGATWHPLRDIAVVGRYPNPFIVPEDRCVDFFDCETGEHLYQLFDAQANKKIHFLNEFNPQGDKLLSALLQHLFGKLILNI
ncbi:DNA damage-binding protein 2 [Armadillidium vulgare]|nr:DNA damage-binding protein 2 [Armadillidium vulgare]